MKTKLLFTVLFSIGMISFANAQSGQRARIHEGVRNGELTRTESARLHYSQHEMRMDRRRARVNGHVSRRERRELRHERRRNSREIFRLKHNHHERHFHF